METFFRIIAIAIFCGIWFSSGCIIFFSIGTTVKNKTLYGTKKKIFLIVLAFISIILLLTSSVSVWMKNTMWMKNTLVIMIIMIVIPFFIGIIIGYKKGRLAKST